jgi:hypothetical protein
MLRPTLAPVWVVLCVTQAGSGYPYSRVSLFILVTPQFSVKALSSASLSLYLFSELPFVIILTFLSFM